MALLLAGGGCGCSLLFIDYFSRVFGGGADTPYQVLGCLYEDKYWVLVFHVS